MKTKTSDIKAWSQIKDEVYGEQGTPHRDDLDHEVESLKIGILINHVRESKHMTQKELGRFVSKKRTYISRVENNSSNLNLKTLFGIVEKGLCGKVNIAINI